METTLIPVLKKKGIEVGLIQYLSTFIQSFAVDFKALPTDL
jgi:hypothetical protein